MLSNGGRTARKSSYIDGLNERERIVVDLLARGYTLRKVASMTGLTERTIYNYRKKPHVQRAVFSLQQELMGQASGQAINVVPDAVDVLTAIMNDPNARASDRIAASKALMNGATQYTERKILERQLTDLEEQLRQTLQLTINPKQSANLPEEDPLAGEELLPSAAIPEDGDR